MKLAITERMLSALRPFSRRLVMFLLEETGDGALPIAIAHAIRDADQLAPWPDPDEAPPNYQRFLPRDVPANIREWAHFLDDAFADGRYEGTASDDALMRRAMYFLQRAEDEAPPAIAAEDVIDEPTR